jgi:hypothetical protein
MWTHELRTEMWTQELLADRDVNAGAVDGDVDTGTTDRDVDTGTTGLQRCKRRNYRHARTTCYEFTLYNYDPNLK